MLKYKLTTQSLTTYRGFQWEIGKKVTTSGEGGLCGPGWLHYYHHPLLAIIMNPKHANIYNPRLFEIEAEGEHKDDFGLKGGCTEMTLVREIKPPRISDVQKMAFIILCAQAVYSDNGGAWDQWAEKWLSGEDRTKESRIKARRAAEVAYSGARAGAGAAYDATASSGATSSDSVSADAAYAAGFYADSIKAQAFNLIALAERAMAIS